jgi:RNA polymerase sigma-70 factor, ECF subfamily
MTIASSRVGSAIGPLPQDTTRETAADQALIRRIAAGDQHAMRWLYGRHHLRLYRWLLRLVDDPALAEDILSEVFLDVWRQAAAFEGRSSVATWLLAIARYKALSARRRRRELPLDEEFAAAIADPADDPETALQKKDGTERVRESLAMLPVGQREVIDLVYYHGRSVKDVAQIVGVPEATVKTRMFHARRKLGELVNAA